MPEWNDIGIVLSAKKYGEQGLIINILTETHGRYVGWLNNHKTKSILGVCLGMQAIGEVFSGEIKNLKNVYHGVETSIKIINHEKLFLDIPKNIMVGRYHSWVVKHPLPICLEATSFDKKGHLMSLRHKNYKVYGVQFHPESILTKYGKKILQNWIND